MFLFVFAGPKEEVTLQNFNFDFSKLSVGGGFSYSFYCVKSGPNCSKRR